MILFHGTTLWRAQQILEGGPDPDFVEPGGNTRADNFSACLTFGPFDCTKRPEEYAWGKARAAFAEGNDEGGPAMLILDVPDHIIALAVDEWFPLTQGFVQFDPGQGLDTLRADWPIVEKRIMTFIGTHE